VHDALPVAALYVPAGHAEQAAPSLPVYPALHTQSVRRREAVAGVYVLEGHEEQLWGPSDAFDALYLPRAHAPHWLDPVL